MNYFSARLDKRMEAVFLLCRKSGYFARYFLVVLSEEVPKATPRIPELRL